MICPNHYCVEELRRNANFCQRCGFELERAQSSWAWLFFVGIAILSSFMLFFALTNSPTDSPTVVVESIVEPSTVVEPTTVVEPATVVEPSTVVEPATVVEPEPDFPVVQKYPASLENLIREAVQEKNLGGVEFLLKEFYNSLSETMPGIGRLADTGDLESAIAEMDELLVLMKSVRSLIGGLTIREMSEYPVLKKHLIVLDQAIMRLEKLRDEMRSSKPQEEKS